MVMSTKLQGQDGPWVIVMEELDDTWIVVKLMLWSSDPMAADRCRYIASMSMVWTVFAE
jgi:hypothetical protein